MNKKIIGATSLLAAGLVAGSFFSIAGANAETNSNVYPVTTTTTDPVSPVTPVTPSTPAPVAPKAHAQETPVTGDLATELSNLALAANPGATVDRVENDTDGAVYEVHLTLADGSHVTVKFDADKKITATETGPAFGPSDGKHGRGPGHGKGDGDHDGDRGGDASGTGSFTVSPLNG